MRASTARREPVCRTRRARARLVVAIGVLFLAAGARAELVHVEAVGSVALGATSRGGAEARQEALEAGIREAVERTALELARQAGSNADADAVRAALGTDAKSFVARYKILEDRGERAPLLESNPGAQREYVVTVEAEIDRSQLRARLAKAGLVAPAAAAAATPGASRQLVLEGVDSYPLWVRIRDMLAARGDRVRPLEFASGRIVADLGGDESLGSVASRLAMGLGEGFDVRPLGESDGALHIGVARRPAADETAPDVAPPAAEPARRAPAATPPEPAESAPTR
jgi:hypothetical protein